MAELLAATACRCYNAINFMADWKQITARIRRARTAKDPAGQLSALYEKTHDAMVAFELAKYFETTALNDDAAKWYGIAAERFRRADWKTKAQEAAVRLGGAVGATPEATFSEVDSPSAQKTAVPIPEPGLPFEQSGAAFDTLGASGSSDAEVAAEAPGTPDESISPSSAPRSIAQASSDDKRRRSRGRRGGRNRRKTSSTASSNVGSESPTAMPSRASTMAASQSRRSAPAAQDSAAPDVSEPEQRQPTDSRSMPTLPVETLPELVGAGPKGRYGDPGLSSRMSLLEMQFRRLLTCQAVKLEEANHAPVGPGVFVLTDSDLTSYYYVEACQTLRIAVANLLRGGSSRRGVDSIKPQLAEHLGITEARVPKYLAEHCVVRWLQLDEGASHFAHFVIAVLRPILNE